MALLEVIDLGKCSGRFLRGLIVFGVISLGWSAGLAKEPSLTAIELYDGASGPAYVQVADVLINGKVELRSCASMPGSIDKSAYGKLAKITVSVGAILERGEDGVLRYSPGEGTAGCVVPDNVKFEHNATYTPASMADIAELRGRTLAAGSDGAAAVPPFKKGVKLVFVAAPDVEKAEYLLAQRISTQPGWQNYLSKYPASPHTDAARRVLASLYVDEGEKAIASYHKTAATASPSYADLKTASAQVHLAHALLPNSESETKLAAELHSKLSALADKGRAELDVYNTALASNSAGYVHLQNAKGLADAMAGVDPNFTPSIKLQAEILQANNAFESAMKSADSAASAKHWDDALKSVKPYRAFASEEPRVARILDLAYTSYFAQAQEFDATKDWQNAITSYQNALNSKETAEARDGLKAAEKEFLSAQNEAAAKAALEKSKTLELQKDIIPAYEVLAGLPDTQQAIVKDDIARLAPEYVLAASQRAKDIAKAYDKIQGMGDEKAVEGAFSYLQRAEELSETEADRQSFQLRLQNLGDELSAWFLDQAKHSLQKPLGSGTELGWAYLKEAEFYKAANFEAVRDQMKIADAAHRMHSKLSARVQFRDQTSQRQSEGFANQMENSIAAGLDTSGMPVLVIRSADNTHQDIEPDFLIAGDVLEHNISMPPTVESVDSQYLVGTHEIPSDDWNKLNRLYESANNELQTARAALQGAEAKGNKKAVFDANREVAVAQKKAEDIRSQLDATPKNRTEDVLRPYSYTKTTYNVINRILLQFRVDDAFSGQKGEPYQIGKEDRKQFVVITDVKSEDANKIKNQGTLPDKGELQNELENVAREELIKKVREKIIELPRKIYDDAQKRETDGYPYDAGEFYLRYLNVAPADQLTEREHARKFLQEHFNFQTFPNEIHENPRATPPLIEGMAQQPK
jgi:hypothetical protein